MKEIICTRKNGSKLNMFWRPKLFDNLLNPVFKWGGGGRGQEEGVGKRSWFSGTRGTSKVGGRTYFLFL